MSGEYESGNDEEEEKLNADDSEIKKLAKKLERKGWKINF